MGSIGDVLIEDPQLGIDNGHGVYSIHPTVESSPFTIENIPFGVISTAQDPTKRCATAFENHAIDLRILEEKGMFQGISGFENSIFGDDNLNIFAALPRASRKEVRSRLIKHLAGNTVDKALENALIPLSEVQNHYPMKTSNFTDFYCSLEHTRNCTEIFGAPAILPNWFLAPMAYNGRTSSLIVSETPIVRPCGVIRPTGGSQPVTFGPTQQLDFELEMGVFLSRALPRGQRVRIDEARDFIFGFVVLNDWSSRDIQVFEMPPLGPFHGKGFGTSVSPWIVTLDALEAVECRRATVQEPSPLPHLDWKDDARATFDISLSVQVKRKGKMIKLGESNVNELHWTPFQQLTHLASAGEGLSVGDVLGTGTISSDKVDEKQEKNGLGCIYERQLARNRLASAADIADSYLQDGDEVVMEAWCLSKRTSRFFGFGQCKGIILPALPVDG